MAVLTTERYLIWKLEHLTRRVAIIRLETVLALAKFTALALCIFALIGLRSLWPPLHSVANETTGMCMLYPALWDFAEGRLGFCRASQREGTWNWSWHEDLVSSPSGPAVRIVVCALDRWLGGLNFLQTRDTEADLVVSVACWLGFDTTGDSPLLRRTRLLGAQAIEITGARWSGSWGSVVLCVDGDDLVLFEVVTPDQASYHRFEPTWRRMVRRTSRTLRRGAD